MVQRYVDIEGERRNVMSVVKLRRSRHSRELRLYDFVNEHGLPAATIGALSWASTQRLQRTEVMLRRPAG